MPLMHRHRFNLVFWLPTDEGIITYSFQPTILPKENEHYTTGELPPPALKGNIWTVTKMYSRILCPKCEQRLEPRRQRRNACTACGSHSPLSFVIQEMGLFLLTREEAKAKKRLRTGKSVSSLQGLILRLRALDPEDVDFYEIAAAYLRKQFRAKRTCGLFFLLLAATPLLLTAFYPPLRLLNVLCGAGAYLFFGALGLALFYQSSDTVHRLPSSSECEDASGRLRRLRSAALKNQQDPIAAMVLQLTDGTVR